MGNVLTSKATRKKKELNRQELQLETARRKLARESRKAHARQNKRAKESALYYVAENGTTVGIHRGRTQDISAHELETLQKLELGLDAYAAEFRLHRLNHSITENLQTASELLPLPEQQRAELKEGIVSNHKVNNSLIRQDFEKFVRPDEEIQTQLLDQIFSDDINNRLRTLLGGVPAPIPEEASGAAGVGAGAEAIPTDAPPPPPPSSEPTIRKKGVNARTGTVSGSSRSPSPSSSPTLKDGNRQSEEQSYAETAPVPSTGSIQ